MGKGRQQMLDEKPRSISFAEIERALDAGMVEMMRPWGDWVRVRRRAPTVKPKHGNHSYLPVWMENEVESFISMAGAPIGFPDVRIAP